MIALYNQKDRQPAKVLEHHLNKVNEAKQSQKQAQVPIEESKKQGSGSQNMGVENSPSNATFYEPTTSQQPDCSQQQDPSKADHVRVESQESNPAFTHYAGSAQGGWIKVKKVDTQAVQAQRMNKQQSPIEKLIQIQSLASLKNKANQQRSNDGIGSHAKKLELEGDSDDDGKQNEMMQELDKKNQYAKEEDAKLDKDEGKKDFDEDEEKEQDMIIDHKDDQPPAPPGGGQVSNQPPKQEVVKQHQFGSNPFASPIYDSRLFDNLNRPMQRQPSSPTTFDNMQGSIPSPMNLTSPQNSSPAYDLEFDDVTNMNVAGQDEDFDSELKDDGEEERVKEQLASVNEHMQEMKQQDPIPAGSVQQRTQLQSAQQSVPQDLQSQQQILFPQNQQDMPGSQFGQVPFLTQQQEHAQQINSAQTVPIPQGTEQPLTESQLIAILRDFRRDVVRKTSEEVIERLSQSSRKRSVKRKEKRRKKQQKHERQETGQEEPSKKKGDSESSSSSSDTSSEPEQDVRSRNNQNRRPDRDRGGNGGAGLSRGNNSSNLHSSSSNQRNRQPHGSRPQNSNSNRSKNQSSGSGSGRTDGKRQHSEIPQRKPNSEVMQSAKKAKKDQERGCTHQAYKLCVTCATPNVLEGNECFDIKKGRCSVEEYLENVNPDDADELRKILSLR